MMYSVSAELEEVVGAKRLTRPMIVKKVWAYIKAHKLQDAKKRRMINPDRKLGSVLGNRPIDMLKMATALNKHIKK
jgi:chromatin remodeling complex protein RSC6